MQHARFLIVGASGFIGSHLNSVLGPERAIATYNTRPIPGGIHFDPATMRLSDTILRGAHGLTHAFLLYAMSNIDQCALNPELAWKINVESQQRVIDELLAAGVVPVFASSDAVFDGTHGMWTEEDAINPVLTYGRHKAQIEKYLLEKSQLSLAVRLAKVVSTVPGSVDMLGDWMDRLEQGADIRCADDQVFSPVDVDDVVRGLVRLAAGDVSGIFHMGSPRAVTRLALLRTLEHEVRKYRNVSARVIPCSIRDFKFVEPRPLDSSMSSRKLYSVLGSDFEDMNAVCARAAARRYGAQTLHHHGGGAGGVHV